MTQKRYVTWHAIHSDAVRLSQMLPKKEWEGMLVITRGGLVPAGLVAGQLNIKRVDTISLESYTDQHTQGELRVLKPAQSKNIGNGLGWLLIDDLVDTGASVRLVKALFPKIHVGVLYAKEAGLKEADTFVEKVSEWIVFPWELSEPHV